MDAVRIDELDTPCLTVGLAVFESNLRLCTDRLVSAGKEPLTLGELRAGAIDFPAVVISELELHGYAIERVDEHGR